MDALSSTVNDCSGYGSGSDEEDTAGLRTSTGTPSIPVLNFTFETMRLNDGNEVVPYFTPRGTYSTPRTDLTAEKLAAELAKGRPDHSFSAHSFTVASAKALDTHLRSSECKLKNIRFVNCGLDKTCFDIICSGLANNSTVETLQIEGCTAGIEMCVALKNVLLSPTPAIHSLNFVNVALPVECLSEIVSGVVGQRDLPKGIVNLCFEGCRLNEKHAEQLERLIAGSSKLHSLILQGNQLGSAIILRPKSMSLHPELAAITVSSSHGVTGSSTAIEAIARGLKVNSTLKNLILASNALGKEDYDVLAAIVGQPGCSVIVNLTGNALEKCATTSQLKTLGSSPRSLASVFQVERKRRGSSLAQRNISQVAASRKITQTFAEKKPDGH